jgi:hypothetical protein
MKRDRTDRRYAALPGRNILSLLLLALLCLDFAAPMAALVLALDPACACCKAKHMACSRSAHGDGWQSAPGCSEGCRRTAGLAPTLLTALPAVTGIEFHEAELRPSYQSIRLALFDDLSRFQRPPPPFSFFA